MNIQRFMGMASFPRQLTPQWWSDPANYFLEILHAIGPYYNSVHVICKQTNTKLSVSESLKMAC